MEILGLTITAPIFWLGVAILFGVIESVTMGLTTIWFSGGALAALLVALLGVGMAVQIAVFIVVSVLLLVFTRPIFVKKLKTGLEKTNVNALVGQEGIVIDEIKQHEPGRIRINGMEWSAVTKNDNITVAVGKTVKIIEIEGVKVIVLPVE